MRIVGTIGAKPEGTDVGEALEDRSRDVIASPRGTAGFLAETSCELLDLSDSWPTGGADLNVGEGAQDILRGKVVRAGLRLDLQDQFARVLELNALPDVGAAVAAGGLPVADFLALRESRASVELRRWLQTVAVTDQGSLLRAVMASLRGDPRSARWPVRLLRLGVTTAAGALGFTPGLLASAADSFFVDRWVNGYSPKVMLDQINRISPPL